MLSYFYENQLIDFCEQVPKTWQEAIQLSCRTLLAKKIINQTYVDEIIASVATYGPYIVLVPGVAMPHASQLSQGVFESAISFTKMPTDVVFEEGNDEKNACLFFTVAAKDQNAHLENISNLSELLMIDGLIEALMAVENMADYQQVMHTFQQ